MKYTDMYPSGFAMKIMATVDLFSDAHNREAIEKVAALREFQQMIIGGADLDAAISIAYHGRELNEDQRMALKIVADGTRPWTLGHLSGLLCDVIETGERKELVSAAQMLLQDVINATDGEGGSGPTLEKAKSLVIKLASDK